MFICVCACARYITHKVLRTAGRTGALRWRERATGDTAGWVLFSKHLWPTRIIHAILCICASHRLSHLPSHHTCTRTHAHVSGAMMRARARKLGVTQSSSSSSSTSAGACVCASVYIYNGDIVHLAHRAFSMLTSYPQPHRA